MLTSEYPARVAGQGEIARTLAAHGLTADFAAAARRPRPAATFEGQMHRIATSGRVVADLRRRFTVDLRQRRFIERLVDHALAEQERADEPAVAPALRNVTDEECIAYAAAGGGAWGSFAAFRRKFAGDLMVPEPAVALAPAPAPPAPPRRPSGPRPAPAPAPAPRRRTSPPLVIRREGAAAHG